MPISAGPSFAMDSMVRAFLGSLEFHWEPNDDAPLIIANNITVIKENMEDMYLPMLAAREILIEDMEDRFSREVDLDYVPWKKRSKSTLDRYNREHAVYSTILKKDEHLYEAAIDRENYQVYGNELFIDTSGFPVYWHAHNVGSTVGKGIKLPRRSFMGISSKAAFEVIDIFDDWMEGFLQIVPPGKTGIPSFRGAFGRFAGRIRMGAPRRPGIVWFDKRKYQ